MKAKMENKKKCKTCLEEKGLYDFFKNKNMSDGLCYRCKICCKHKVKTPIKEYQEKKVCRACNEDKYLHEFSQSGNGNFLHKCRVCVNNKKLNIRASTENIVYIKEDFLIEEQWKDIPEYEGLYQISDLGRVKSLGGNHRGTSRPNDIILIPYENINGYLLIKASKNGITKDMLIHKAVAMTFLSHKPNGFERVIDHINNVRTDNRVSNLQIITQRENAIKNTTRGNTSNCVGVRKFKNKYRVDIRIGSSKIYMGSYKEEQEACDIYNIALIKILDYDGNNHDFREKVKAFNKSKNS